MESEGELQELRTWPGDSLIWRRYGGGVGNRRRWAERFAMSEQQQSDGKSQSGGQTKAGVQAFPAESGTLPHRPWTPMSLVNGRGPQAKRCGRDEAKRKSVRKSMPLRGRRGAEEVAQKPLRRAIGKSKVQITPLLCAQRPPGAHLQCRLRQIG